MQAKPMKQASPKLPTHAQKADIETLTAVPDDGIDLSDIPEVCDWSGAKRGQFYRPVRK